MRTGDSGARGNRIHTDTDISLATPTGHHATGCSHCSRRFTRLHQNFRDELSLLHATSLIYFGLRYAHSLFTVAVQVNRTVATVQQRVRSTDTPPFPPIPPPSFLPSFLPSHPPSSLGLTHSASICPRALRQKHSSRRSLSNELDGCNCRSFVRSFGAHKIQDVFSLLVRRGLQVPERLRPHAVLQELRQGGHWRRRCVSVRPR